MNSYYTALKNKNNIEYFSSKIDKLNWAPGFGVELIANLKDNIIGIGLEANFIKDQQLIQYLVVKYQLNPISLKEIISIEAFLIFPIRLNGYYLYFITPKIQLTFLGGPDFYYYMCKSLSLLHNIEHFTDEIGTIFDECEKSQDPIFQDFF